MAKSTLTSWLPAAPGNVFQRNKAIRRAAEEKGVKVINLSIGQPSGPALELACKATAKAVMSRDQNMHEYQDNGCLPIPDFAKRFVRCHVGDCLDDVEGLGYLPIPGIKPMLGLIPLACGAVARDTPYLTVFTCTDPGYPTPAYWSEVYGSDISHVALKLSPDNGFLFTLDQITTEREVGRCLVMMNFPHNPSGRAMDEDWVRHVCGYCQQRDIRLVNDAAYTLVTHESGHPTLAQIACQFPGLSWAEAFSASKAGNFTGWRIGAMVGSADFIDDIARIKGDADSGFAAFAAIGILEQLENGMDEVKATQVLYHQRIRALISILRPRGMKLAVTPQAGFFTLWQTPKMAFGQVITDAEHFNRLMLENTGVLGVPFNPYIRYAVVNDVLANANGIAEAFDKASVAY